LIFIMPERRAFFRNGGFRAQAPAPQRERDIRAVRRETIPFYLILIWKDG